MKKEFSLQGRYVYIYAKGPWEFAGKVDYSDESMIVISDGNAPVVIYRQNIVAAKIIDEKDFEKISNSQTIEEYDPGQEDELPSMPVSKVATLGGKTNSRYDMEVPNDSDQSAYYGSLIPSDMLLEFEDEEEQYPVDFSMSMSSLSEDNIKQRLIHDSRKENEYDRKEDNK